MTELVRTGSVWQENEYVQVLETTHKETSGGSASLEVLQNFLNNIKATEDSIIQADATMTELEKEIAEKKNQAEIAEREKQILEQNKNELQEMMENQKKSHEQHEKMLIEKMEQDRLKMVEENERVIKQKLE
ncbi:hypothetical protein GDO86_019759, partial [Hymenochirus boettgeri]